MVAEGETHLCTTILLPSDGMFRIGWPLWGGLRQPRKSLRAAALRTSKRYGLTPMMSLCRVDLVGQLSSAGKRGGAAGLGEFELYGWHP